MSPEEAVEQLVRSDPRFALAEAEIRGETYRVFANAPRTLRDLLDVCAENYEGRDVLVYQDERWSHDAFRKEIDRLANAMIARLGVRPGDRVAVAMRNFPEFPILALAIASIGAVFVPLNAWLAEEEFAYAFEDSGARIVFADGPRAERIRPLAARLGLTIVPVRDAEGPTAEKPDYADLRDSASDGPPPDASIAPDDDFAIMYSSGSSGTPKGVVLTHRGPISAVWSWLLGITAAPLVDGAPEPPADPRPPVSLIVTPLFHVTALHANFLQGLTVGATLVLMYRWDAEEAVRIIKAESVTRFVGVPTQSAELMQAARSLGEDLDSLESIGAGGAKRPAAQVGQLAEAFPHAQIATGWGMTETNALGVTMTGPGYVAQPEAGGSLTPPLQDMRIVDDADRDLPTGAVGELLVRSPANMRCYLNNPEATAATLQGGWLRTGDLARVDAVGIIFFVDRKKSIIIRGGENISCLEVEGALHRHQDVLEACVFPVPDPRLGEIVGAAVHLRDGAAADEGALAGFVKAHIAAFKTPERFWLHDAPLPRGATAKLDRRGIRAACLAQDAAAREAPRCA